MPTDEDTAIVEISARDRGPRLAIFYEHPEWFTALFAELERRGVAYDRLLAHEHRFDPAERQCPDAVVGFDPLPKFVDYLLDRAGRGKPASIRSG